MKEVTVPFSLQKSGLRLTKRSPRNTSLLVEAVGAVPEDGVLRALELLDTLDVSSLNCTFPYPQVFALRELTIICTPTAIYEIEGGTPVLHLDNLTEGTTWSVADFHNFVVLVNGKHAIKRDGISGEYLEATDIPVSYCCCDLNGQALFGAPGVILP